MFSSMCTNFNFNILEKQHIWDSRVQNAEVASLLQAETRMALRNISAILKKAGGGLEHIVKVTGKPKVVIVKGFVYCEVNYKKEFKISFGYHQKVTT